MCSPPALDGGGVERFEAMPLQSELPFSTGLAAFHLLRAEGSLSNSCAPSEKEIPFFLCCGESPSPQGCIFPTQQRGPRMKWFWGRRLPETGRGGKGKKQRRTRKKDRLNPSQPATHREVRLLIEAWPKTGS